MQKSAALDAGLDFNQSRAFTAFWRGICVAIVGGAGSGKSFLLERILEQARRRHGASGVMACAWTNNAATNIGGATIHSWFGVRAGFPFKKEELWEMVQRDKALCDALRNIEIILIDEIFVMKAHVLDAIDWVMRNLASTDRLSCVPMGARQFVCAGDPFQLEPVGVSGTDDYNRQVFSARSWFLTFGGFGSGVIAVLSDNHRQCKDADFYEILNRIRSGSSTDRDMRTLNNTSALSDVSAASHTILCLRKYQVDAVNRSELVKLPGPYHRGIAEDEYFIRKTSAVEKMLRDAVPGCVTVKIGCNVILTRKVGSIIPGTRVTVTRVIFGNTRACSLELEVKAIAENVIQKVSPMKFEVLGPGGSLYASRRQLPVVSAYALTVHRAQGLTLDKVAMDFTKVGNWTPTGMVYVALSRCTSLSVLWVRGLQRKHIVVNEEAKQLIRDIRTLKKHFRYRVIGLSGERIDKEDARESLSKKRQYTASHNVAKVNGERSIVRRLK